MKKRVRSLILLLLLLLLAGGAAWYISQNPDWSTQLPANWNQTLIKLKLLSSEASPTQLAASGYIEATEVSMAPEVSGYIERILVTEGDTVSAGQLLIELKTDLLEAQLAEAQAAVKVAQAQLTLLQAGPASQDIAVVKEAVNVALTQQDAAYQNWQDALALRDNPQELALQISAAASQLAIAERRLEQMIPLKDAAELVNALRERQVKLIEEGRNIHLEIPANPAGFSIPSNVDLLEDMRGAAPGDDIRAHVEFPEGIKRQAWAGWNLASSDLWGAWTGLNGAVANREAAQQNLANLEALRNNPQQLQLQALQAETAYRQAQAAVAVAQANLALIRAGATAEQIKVAQTAVAQAQAAVDTLTVQRQKYLLHAPTAGVIMDLPAHSGEFARPGRTLLSLGNLTTLDLKLYLPEPDLGRVKLGQQVSVTVDTYPGQSFMGQVVWIASEAEFTPKNVQTQEQRINTVFAVKVQLANPEQKLKPGMPADALFSEPSGL